MLPHTYITKNGIKYVESLMRARVNVDSNSSVGNLSKIERHEIRTLNVVNRFPLFLNYQIYQSKSIGFFEKYYVLDVAKNLFESLLIVLSRNESQDEYCKAALKIQPSLLSKIKTNLQINKTKIMLNGMRVRSTKKISEIKIYGLFSHRELNMPKQCYSIEVENENKIYYRIRNKLTRYQHIQIMQKKKLLYNRNNYMYQQFYVDSYQNFIKCQYVNQLIVQINVEISGKFIFNKMDISLPLYMLNPITSHLMQIQIVSIPGRPQNQRALLTDIDFFMKGNPFLV